MNTWIWLAARTLAAAGLVYLAWLAPYIGFGAAEVTADTGDDYFVEGEWVFLFSIVLGAASAWSAVLTLMSWHREDYYPGVIARRIFFTVLAVLLVVGVVIVVPAAPRAADYYTVTTSTLAGWPSDMIGWAAVPLGLNALALVVLYLWPRISSNRR